MKNFKIWKSVILIFVIACIMILSVSCNFFASFTKDETENQDVEITSLSLGKSTLSMSVGGMDYISVSIKPQTAQKEVALIWSYDKSIIECDTSSNWGITITALKEGQTSLKCSYGGYDATCLVTVSGFSEGYESTTEPYIYSNTTVLQTSPGITEKVFVSLYGGDANDIDGYTWTIDNSSVASIQPTGQYCLITAKGSGYARIKITHTKASYPYYMGIYVFEDATKVSYITTQNNILTMNTGDSVQTINVSLVNGKDTSLDSSFQWEILEKNSDEIPISFDFNANNAVITPIKSGSCTVRVTHPDAIYPLDILCRVITIVQNVYILPDNTKVSMNGDEQKTVSCSLENLKDGEYSIDEYEYKLDDYNVAEIVNFVGNQVILKGKANGSCKLLISHPKAKYTREVLLIVTGQLTDAIDASCFISTSQDYIRTKVGEDMTSLSISLKGGDDGDESGFIWSVKSSAIDGTSDVIKLETTNGSVIVSRAAAQTYAFGTAYITPLAEGTAVISVSHPKVLYPTEILVKVLNKEAILTEPLYFSGNGMIKILNGETYDYTVELKGKNKTSSDEENIEWTAEDSRISIASSGAMAQISAPSQGNGQTISYIKIRHQKCDTDKKVLVLTADTQESLDSMKALYSDKLYYNIEIGDTCVLMANSVGFEGTYDEETETYMSYDFSTVQWAIKNPTICSVEKTQSNPLNAIIKGLKAGTTTVSILIEDVSCDFTVTVYPEGTVATEPEVYFTTTQNVISLSSKGKSSSVYVSAVNLSSVEYSNITWTSDNEDIATIIPNGTSGTITANSEGTAIIRVSHPDSQNTLKIYVRVGSEYVIKESEPVVYISSIDVITMLKDSQSQKFQAVLVNYSEVDVSGFTFSIDDESVAKISAQTTQGIAYVQPVTSGQAEITIRHTATEFTKKVLVIVGNSEEELASFTYITTNQNVVAIGEGNTKNVSVSIKNSDEIIFDGYTWTSSNPSVVDISASGANAIFTGNSIGTAIITVSNKACKYPLTIIAQVVDPIAASSNPFIYLNSSVLTLTVSSNFTNITADLVGGNESDFSDFTWTTNDSSICVVYGQNGVGKVRALKEGQTYITVKHPKAISPAQILVVCDKKVDTECSISVPTSIITMKPTDSSQTFSATLVNGSINDKYNFKWSLDVYDVIDFQYSANVCTISPKQSGSCTITVSHPKAAYEQQIVVNVQEYTSFSFPNTNITITQGNVSFITMQVPTTKVTTHVEYSVDNSAICSISGTKAVAQIQAIETGTTTVRAKLIASSTGLVQAESEMMVYVKEKATDSAYITASTTIYTVQKGKSQTLSANLSGNGVAITDSANLTWSTNDSDVIQITGISSDGKVRGNQIYITALKSGEALITCSHEKAASTLQFYVVVPGAAEKVISLNKTYITLTKGTSGTTIKANIENSESSSDYSNLIWTCADVSGKGNQIARVMGSTNSEGEVTGQTVTILPLAKGEAIITAQLPNVEKVATCTVIVQETKSFSLEQTSKKVQPFHSAKVKFTVSPPDASYSFTKIQDDEYFTYKDLGVDENGVGYVQIDGLKEGNGMLHCVTNDGAKGSLSVKVSWDYLFTLDTYSISGEPTKSYQIVYTVNPSDAIINVKDSNKLFQITTKKGGVTSGTGLITLVPTSTGDSELTITATNPNDENKVIGSYKISANISYSKLTITPKIISDVATACGELAYYSQIKGDTIYVGDGETITVKLNCAESKVKPIYNFTSTSLSRGLAVNELSDDTFTISSSTDETQEAYLIIEGYAPTYNGSRKYKDGKEIKPDDFMIEMNYCNSGFNINECWSYPYVRIVNSVNGQIEQEKNFGKKIHAIYDWGWKNQNPTCTFFINDLSYGSGWGRVRDTSLDGKCISVEDFEKSLWYYVPSKTVGYGMDYGQGNDFRGNVKIVHQEGEINNIKAELQKYTLDTKVISDKSGSAGSLRITVSAPGCKSTTLSFPIYLETRYSQCTYKR